MIVGIAIQPGSERDRPDVAVVRKITPTLHAFKVLLCLLARTREMRWHRAVAAEVEGAMIAAWMRFVVCTESVCILAGVTDGNYGSPPISCSVHDK